MEQNGKNIIDLLARLWKAIQFLNVEYTDPLTDPLIAEVPNKVDFLCTISHEHREPRVGGANWELKWVAVHFID